MTLKLTTRIREVLCPIFLCLLLAISTSTHANDVKTSNDVSSIFVYLKQIKNDADYLTKIDTLIENIDENTPTEVMIEIDLIKIKALSKFANPREASDFAHEIYQKYQREDYSSEKQYGRVMVEIVKSSAKRLDFSLSLEIVQQMREITYQTPSSYLEFVIDRCLMEIYIESFDYERALEVELKMLSDPIYESEKSFISWKPSLYNEIAFIYNRIGNGEEALKYLTSAKAAYELARDKQKLEGSRLVRAVAINKGNRARAYLLTENYTEAERLGRDVLEAGISLKQAYIIALGHRLIGSANYNAGHYEKARIALAKGIQSADENNIGTMQLTLYKEYALTLEALGHHEEALNWQKKQFSVEIETQRLAASAREALNGAEARALKRYQELMTLKQVNETQREISNRDDKIKKLLAVVAIVFACFSYSAFSNRRRLLRQAERMKDVNTKLKTATLHDPLTGLPNRSYIKAHLDKELAVAKEQNKNISAIHIDLDHFKEANDSYGHAAGDHILIEIAKRMKISCDADKVVARIGGDEFLMVATNVIDQASIKADMEAMLKHIMTPLNYEGITIHSSASIGITCEPAQNCDSSDLIVNSDLALYEAKQDGRGCIRIFEPHMRDALNRRKLLEAELIRALDVEKIQTYFQPQINISTNKVIGIEALVRWNHETRGFIPPQEFLPIAESSGHMVRLGRYVMDQAILEASTWHKEKIPFGRLGINASAAELREDSFVDWVLGTAEKHGLPTHMLSVEILETVMVKDERLNLTEKLKRLRHAGIHIELDDFGTGYASLQQVRTEEIDRLKIDRSFIRDIDTQADKSIIVKAIVEMANKMDIMVLAEGAETLNELDVLLSLGCHTVQGFGVAKPMPAAVIRDWMKIFIPQVENNIDTSTTTRLRVVK